MHAVERVGVTDLFDEVAGNRHTGIRITLDAFDDRARHGELWHIRRELAGH